MCRAECCCLFHIRDVCGQVESWRDVDPEVVQDCAQLCKANSIAGNKVNNVDIVITPVSNLKKTADMDIGQVGFKTGKDVIKVKVETRVNAIINRLEKTKQEKFPDLAQEKQDRLDSERAAKKAIAREIKAREEAEAKAYAQQKQERS
jgi:hypothetical protein